MIWTLWKGRQETGNGPVHFQFGPVWFSHPVCGQCLWERKSLAETGHEMTDAGQSCVIVHPRRKATLLGNTPQILLLTHASLWSVGGEWSWTGQPHHVDSAWALPPCSLWKSLGWFSAGCITNAPSVAHPGSTQAGLAAWNNLFHRDLHFNTGLRTFQNYKVSPF